MFIKEIIKKNPGFDKTFVYYRLMESVRTPAGPRHRKIIDLGRLDLPKEDHKALANRIEELLCGQQSLFAVPDHVESLAIHYAGLIKQKEMQSIPVEVVEQPDWETVDLKSLSQGKSRTIGGEGVAYDAFKRLDFPQMLSALGFSQDQIHKVALLVIGRLLHPASERGTAMWARQISALDELIGADFDHLSNNALYRTSDLLLGHRDEIEQRLAERERGLYGLGEKIILYDLTNTYLEGSAHESTLAGRRHSKEKRHDCPLLTLALVVDEEGFCKKSMVLPGKVDEPGTLEAFLETCDAELNRRQPLFKERPTVVIDAGIGTKKNLELIRSKGFHYITVSRRKLADPPREGLVTIRDEKDSTIRAKRLEHDGGVLLYCESSGRARKEESMKAQFQRRYEEGLKEIAASISRKGGIKQYDKVLLRLGRLQERYPTIAQFYRIDVRQERGKAKELTWEIDRDEELRARFSGSYYIRSSRTDLDEKELWSLYMMLNRVEDSFRCLKSELGLRPVYHRKDHRQEAHLFIAVLAYHLLTSIQSKLKEKGISYRWETIRTGLSSQTRVTASITNAKGERIHIRQTTDPEPFHFQIHRALGLPPKPLSAKRSKT